MVLPEVLLGSWRAALVGILVGIFMRSLGVLRVRHYACFAQSRDDV